MASTAGIASASSIQMDYMKLLITQLQNQDPMEPLDNSEMASQLAQFASLQQLETMNTNFSDVLTATKRGYANSLLGKQVTFYARDEVSGELDKTVGSVDSVFYDPDGDCLLGVTVGEGEEAQEFTLGLGAVVLVEE